MGEEPIWSSDISTPIKDGIFCKASEGRLSLPITLDQLRGHRRHGPPKVHGPILISPATPEEVWNLVLVGPSCPAGKGEEEAWGRGGVWKRMERASIQESFFSCRQLPSPGCIFNLSPLVKPWGGLGPCLEFRQAGKGLSLAEFQGWGTCRFPAPANHSCHLLSPEKSLQCRAGGSPFPHHSAVASGGNKANPVVCSGLLLLAHVSGSGRRALLKRPPLTLRETKNSLHKQALCIWDILLWLLQWKNGWLANMQDSGQGFKSHNCLWNRRPRRGGRPRLQPWNELRVA